MKILRISCLSALVAAGVLVIANGAVYGSSHEKPSGTDTEIRIDADAVSKNHEFIRISDGRIRPKVQELASDDAVGWVNYSSRIARVSFPREVGRSLICTSETSFRLAGDRLESAPIQSKQFASLCNFKPGEYDYRVDFYRGAGSGHSLAPERSLDGKLVVK